MDWPCPGTRLVTVHHDSFWGSGLDNRPFGEAGLGGQWLVSGQAVVERRNRNWQAGRRALFNYVQTAPLTPFRTGPGPPPALPWVLRNTGPEAPSPTVVGGARISAGNVTLPKSLIILMTWTKLPSTTLVWMVVKQARGASSSGAPQPAPVSQVRASSRSPQFHSRWMPSRIAGKEIGNFLCPEVFRPELWPGRDRIVGTKQRLLKPPGPQPRENIKSKCLHHIFCQFSATQ